MACFGLDSMVRWGAVKDRTMPSQRLCAVTRGAVLGVVPPAIRINEAGNPEGFPPPGV